MPDIIKANADGRAEIAMELTSGTILCEKNADMRLPMASTTKIMTGLIIAEECDLSEVFTVPDEAVGVEGSSIYLKRDEVVSVKDLLYGLLLRSGNDAATALAIHRGGSVEKFVEEMNAKAEELGAKDTHFANPSGLPDDKHYTTARDLCNIARAAMQNEVFSRVVATRNYDGDFRSFINKNKLLRSFDGANGVKTGYTQSAGRCLVSSAKRGNMDVVCVVLNCYDMYERSSAILESCFKNYALESLSADKTFLYNGKMCTARENYSFVVPRGKSLSFALVEGNGQKNDEIVAKLKILCENNLLFECNLYNIEE